MSRSHNPGQHADRFGLVRFRSPLLSESLLLSFPLGTKMFQFPRFASMTYVFSHGYLDITPGGFPHSEIPGSKPVCGSPRLIAAYHVLHRLPMPRHPPSALSSLTKIVIFFLRTTDFSVCCPYLIFKEQVDYCFPSRVISDSSREAIILYRIAVSQLVEVTGIEPMTSCVQSRRSPS